jgi:hypothetical protein
LLKGGAQHSRHQTTCAHVAPRNSRSCKCLFWPSQKEFPHWPVPPARPLRRAPAGRATIAHTKVAPPTLAARMQMLASEGPLGCNVESAERNARRRKQTLMFVPTAAGGCPAPMARRHDLRCYGAGRGGLSDIAFDPVAAMAWPSMRPAALCSALTPVRMCVVVGLASPLLREVRSRRAR